MMKWVRNIKTSIVRSMRDEPGTILAAVAIIAFFVALAALATLALSVSQVESIDDETFRLQAATVSEAGMEESIYGVKFKDETKMPKDIAGLSDMTPQQLTQILRNPELVNGVPYADDPQRNYYSAMESINIEKNTEPGFKTILGDSSKFDVTYVDDTTVVRDLKEYDYQKLSENNENWVFSLGETRKTESKVRSSLSAKTWDQTDITLQRRVVQTTNYNQNHIEPPMVESEHKSYDPGQSRNWVVSYPSDPSNPNRHVTGIDLVIDGAHLGLGSAGDKITFSAWNGTSFDSPFDGIPGPVTEGGPNFVTSSPYKTNTIKVTMNTDDIDDVAETTANYGFRVTGVEYHFDSDRLPAYYETAHPYDEIENATSYTQRPEFIQVVYSPYALPRNKVNPIKQPGPDIVPPNPLDTSGSMPSPSNEKWDINALKSIGGNTFQVMRLHFDDLFMLETGDSLEVYNANNGQLMSVYTETSGANIYTPWAYRTNPDFPLAIAMIFKRDGNNASSSHNYGYKVDTLEYTDQEGNFQVLDNPVQTTSHSNNVGYNDGLGGDMRYTTVFKPGKPASGNVTNWKVIFDTDSDLVRNMGDTDRIILRVWSLLGPVPDTFFVSPTGFYSSLIGTNNYKSIEDLKGRSVDMGTLNWLEIISEFDNKNSFVSSDENFGWTITRIDVKYDDAVAEDKTPPGLRSSAITLRSIANKTATTESMIYPAFGATPATRGEWWVNSKDKKQILLHFDLDSFRMEDGDRVEIYDDKGNLIQLLIPEGTDNNTFTPGGPYGGGENGGIIIPADTLMPNPPQELVDTKGWIIIPSESAKIILRGDGSTNAGFSGFDVDRVAFWSPTANIRSIMGDFSTDDTGGYSKEETDSIKKFLQY